MSIMEVVQSYPDTVPVFMYAGMGCFGCMAAHGIDIDSLMDALNEIVNVSNDPDEILASK